MVNLKKNYFISLLHNAVNLLIYNCITLLLINNFIFNYSYFCNNRTTKGKCIKTQTTKRAYTKNIKNG